MSWSEREGVKVKRLKGPQRMEKDKEMGNELACWVCTNTHRPTRCVVVIDCKVGLMEDVGFRWGKWR